MLYSIRVQNRKHFILFIIYKDNEIKKNAEHHK